MKSLLCAGCVAILACVSWVALKTFSPFIAFSIQEKLKGNHNTLICQAGKECSLTAQSFTLTEEELERHAVFSPDLSVEEIGRIHAQWERRSDAKRARGKGWNVVHIGPADLSDDDLATYKRIVPFMEGGGQIVLVEPHPGQQFRLRQRIRTVHNDSVATILPVAVCTETGDGMTFYKVSEAFFREYGNLFYYIRYWASLDKQHLLDETQYFRSNAKVRLFKSMHLLPEMFPETVAEWLPYIEEVRVNCLSPQSLLERKKILAKDLDILILDAEGSDVELMGHFLAMEGFAPETIMFEWHLHANNARKLEALLQLVRTLHSRGYSIHRHNHDVVAVAQVPR